MKLGECTTASSPNWYLVCKLL